MNDPFRVSEIDHVEVFVPDRHEAAEWYRRVLGLRVVAEFEHWSHGTGGPLMIAAADRRSKLALFQGPSQASGKLLGIRRIAFAVDAAGFLLFLQLLDALEVFDAAGRRVTRDSVVDHEQAFSIYFTDPWGTPLELTSYDAGAIRAAITHAAGA